MRRTAIPQLFALTAVLAYACPHSDAQSADTDRRLVWKLPVHEGVVTPPVVADGLVFFVRPLERNSLRWMPGAGRSCGHMIGSL